MRATNHRDPCTLLKCQIILLDVNYHGTFAVLEVLTFGCAAATTDPGQAKFLESAQLLDENCEETYDEIKSGRG